MTTPLGRIRRGATALFIIFAVAVVGYRLAGWSWLEAVYMVTITVSTVGYSEVGPTTPAVRVLTIFIIVFGVSASAYTFGGFIQMLTQGEIDRALGKLRMSREIQSLNHHVIVCGFGRIGRILTNELRSNHKSFIVIERNPERIAEAEALHYPTCRGDATDEDVLLAAGVTRAKSLLTTLPDDACNVFISLTSRNLNAKLNIIARAELHSTQKKLLQAGANHVVLPAAIGAQRMAAMVAHPSAVEFLELVAGRGHLDVEIDEYAIESSSKLSGKVVGDIEGHIRHGLLVIAIKQQSGEMLFNPGNEFVLAAGQTMILMGKVDALRRFRAETAS